MGRYINTSGGELAIYSDTGFTTKVGTLYRGSACSCVFKHDDAVVVLYRISSDGAFKVGFTDYLGGVQEDQAPCE